MKVERSYAESYAEAAQVFECTEIMEGFTKGQHYSGVAFDGEEGEYVIGFETNDYGKGHYQSYKPHTFFKEVNASMEEAATLALLDEQYKETINQ